MALSLTQDQTIMMHHRNRDLVPELDRAGNKTGQSWNSMIVNFLYIQQKNSCMQMKNSYGAPYYN